MKPEIQNLKWKILFAFSLLVIASSMLVAVFRQLPFENEGGLLAIDWRWLHAGLEGGGLRYSSDSGIRNPPWSLWLVRPLGLLSLRDGWAMLTLATLIVLIISVPRTSNRSIFWSSLALLITSFPSVRHIVDGNFEALVISGVLLLLHASQRQDPLTLAIGILLVTAKPQEVWLLLPVLAIQVFRTWPARKWLTASVLVLLVIGLSAPWLPDWWPAFTYVGQRHGGGILDIGLIAALKRLGAPPPLVVLAWGMLLFSTAGAIWQTRGLGQPITRQWAAFLMTASMLLSPYTAGNSVLVILAIGIIPLFQQIPLLGILLIILTDALYFTQVDFQYWYGAYYWTAWLILTWGVLGYTSRQRAPSLTESTEQREQLV